MYRFLFKEESKQFLKKLQNFLLLSFSHFKFSCNQKLRWVSGTSIFEKNKVKSNVIHNCKNGIHDLHNIIVECGISPLESRSKLTLHRIEQFSILQCRIRVMS